METEQPPTSPPPSQQPSGVRYGSYDTTIDLKRRLVLAAEIRGGMDRQRDGNSFFVFRGINKKIWFYPRNPYLRLVSQARVGLTPSDKELAIYQTLVGNTYELEWDKQGRVIVPEKLLTRAEIKLPAEVTLVGTLDHYQLWKRAEWEAHSDGLDANLGSILNGAKENGIKL